MSFGDKVAKKLRLAMGSRAISQTAMAEKAGITIQTVNAFCNGRGAVLNASLEKMANALGISAESLLSDAADSQAPVGLEQIVERAVAQAFERTLPKADDPDAQADFLQIIRTLSSLDADSMRKALLVAETMREEFKSRASAQPKKKTR